MTEVAGPRVLASGPRFERIFRPAHPGIFRVMVTIGLYVCSPTLSTSRERAVMREPEQAGKSILHEPLHLIVRALSNVIARPSLRKTIAAVVVRDAWRPAFGLSGGFFRTGCA